MTDVIMPQMGESIAEGTVTKWMKNVGDKVQRDEPLFEISTDKVDAEIPVPASGILKEIRVQPGATVPINTVVGVIAAEGEAVATAPAPAAPPAPAPPSSPSAPPAPPPTAAAAPPAPSAVSAGPSAPAFAPSASSQADGAAGPAPRPAPSPPAPSVPREPPRPAPSAAPPPAMPPTPPRPTWSPAPPPPSASSRVEVVPMSPIRKKTAEHMVLSKRISAHVTTVFAIDMTRVDHLREKYRPQYEERSGVKLTYMPFILKATIDALKAFPVLNSSLEGDAIVYRHDVNIGMAVALDWGLIVPVIRNADEKNILGLARAVVDLAERARTKRLKVEEVQGGTFTITNPGIFGSVFGTPIINQPQVAILGVGAIEKRAVVRDDAIAIRPMVYLALSFDHRIIDGAVADQFMGRLKSRIAEWDEAVL